jgi:hypothetical protein
MAVHQGLLSGGWDRVMYNKRYIVWFYVLNLALAWLGASAFNNQTHDFLDHSLLADRVVNGFDVGVPVGMFMQPEFGSIHSLSGPSLHFALLFLFLTALFMPGVLMGLASTYRLPREDFFRACGKNLWRFIRLMIVAGIVMGAVAGALFGLHGLLEKKAAESTNELLLPEVRVAGLIVIFLVMAALRIWFDLAGADVVLSDQRAVRRSIGKSFRHAWRSLGRLLGSYVVTTAVAAVVLCVGLLTWTKFVPAAGVVRATLLGQLILLLLLIPRFWQRGIAVSYYLQNMVEPIAIVQSFTSVTARPIMVEASVAGPVVPDAPPPPA